MKSRRDFLTSDQTNSVLLIKLKLFYKNDQSINDIIIINYLEKYGFELI